MSTDDFAPTLVYTPGVAIVARREVDEPVVEEVTHEDLPLVRFPTYIHLSSPALSDFSGVLGSVLFKCGFSVEPHSYQTINALVAGGGFAVTDYSTGIAISPLSEDRAYRVSMASREWNDGMPLPEDLDVPTGNDYQTQPSQENRNGQETDQAGQEGRQELLNSDAARATLEGLRDSKGARYLRQLCEDRSLPTARAGDDMIDTLLANLSAEAIATLVS